MNKNITVLKFGGSVLRDENDLQRVVHEIYRRWRRGSSVLAVVSAFGGATDELVERSSAFGDEPHPVALASLLATGEATSAAFLGLALKQAGVPAKILTPHQVGIRTVGDSLDAEPVDANVERLRKELADAVVVASGFIGVNDAGDLTLLGRGGSDLTALFLAQKLDAECILLKDVDGMYEANPSGFNTAPRRFTHASYATTLGLAGELVQPKAVRFAEVHRQNFEIAALGAGYGTRIGDFDDELATAWPLDKKRLRVGLLGCGTVGGGVYQRLSALAEFFEIVGVVNLDQEKALAAGIDADLIADNARKLIERDVDVVIELIGGIDPAGSLIRHSLNLGRHVITANKALVAAEGPSLEERARNAGVTIRYSASVGGSLPALEAVAFAASTSRIRSISGIINGTCNYICDQLSAGTGLGDAVALAQKAGYAEADPTLDLDGSDAAQKLILLARAAFGSELNFSEIAREGFDELSQAKAQNAKARGRSYRLIAECRQTANGPDASVGPVELPNAHPLAQIKGADNCLVIESETGDIMTLTARGAGRYATAEAVIADLFDLRHSIGVPANLPVENKAYLEVSA